MNPNLPVGGSAFDQGGASVGALPEDVTQVALTLRFGVFDTEQQGLDRLPNAEATAVRSGLLALGVRHHFGEGFAVELNAPAGTLQLAPGRGQPAQHLNGLGDVQLSARYELAALWGAGGFSPSVVVQGGVGLPTGRQARFEDPNGIVPPNVLSLGMAAFTANARVLVTQYVHRRVALTAWAGTALPVTRTDLGILGGLSVDGGAGAVVQVADFAWLSGRVSAQHRERSDELLEGTILNSGGQWLAAEASVALRAHERAVVVLGGRAPFFAHVNGRQISETATVFVSVATTFGVEEDEHDHDHGHDDDHEHDHSESESDSDSESESESESDSDSESESESDSDVEDLARGGESFAVRDALVPGKVTVIDFWAEWCEPCHDVDALLREVAARDDRLAVRRVEVPTFDTAVAREHIASASGLPVLWIYAPSGERVAVIESGSVADVERAVEDALAAAR